jgi:hypothetical protein
MQHIKNFLVKNKKIIFAVWSVLIGALIITSFAFAIVDINPTQNKLNKNLNYDRVYEDLERIADESHYIGAGDEHPEFGNTGHDDLADYIEDQILIMADENGKNNFQPILPIGSENKPQLNGPEVSQTGVDEDGNPTYDVINPEINSFISGDMQTTTPVLYKIYHQDAMREGLHGGVNTGNYAMLTTFMAFLPGTNPNEKALMMTAHYDGKGTPDTDEFLPNGDPDENGEIFHAVADDGIAVASILEIMRYAVNHPVENNLIFLFTDGEEAGLYGAHAFMKEFEKAGVNPQDKIGMIGNFEATGTSGTLAMFQTGENEAETIKSFAGIVGTIYTNSLATWLYNQMPNGTDLTVYKEAGLAGLNFANVGNGQNYHHEADSLENLTPELVIQNLNMMLAIYNHYGNFDFNNIQKGQALIYFNFYNLGLVFFPTWVMYIFLALMLAGLILSLALNYKNLSWKGTLNILKAGGVVLLSLGIAIGLTYVFALIMNAAVGGWLVAKSSTVGIMLGQMFFAIVVFTIALYFFSKLFKVKREQVNTFTAVLYFILTAAIFFIVPGGAFLFLLAALVNILALTLEKTIKNKTANSIIKKSGLHLVSSVLIFTSTVTLGLIIIQAIGTSLAPFAVALPLLALANFPLLLQEVKFKQIGTKIKTTTIALKNKLSKKKNQEVVEVK